MNHFDLLTIIHYQVILTLNNVFSPFIYQRFLYVNLYYYV